jgi:hypothetical protein
MKPHTTRTLAPIHFEDLDPHRFEDLIRELVYDFRNWQSIEATGRGGSDDGFDIRAFEKAESVDSGEESENESADDEPQVAHPMEGNMWMIQAKREKSIGPARVREILDEVDAKNPPYGYVLAAAANFSKESHDAFREVLREKGVMEFFLWGGGELEDMLYQPKNDRILFAFFGISLTVKRRTRVTSVRSEVAVKNKLLKLFGGQFTGSLNVLVRDIDDEQYPEKTAYDDFEKVPRWAQYEAFELHSWGVLVHVQESFAYLDRETNEWDSTEAIDLRNLDTGDHNELNRKHRRKLLVEDTVDFFPRDKRATYCKDGLIEFENIKLVDEKGDHRYPMPHLYVVYKAGKGPFLGYHQYFEVGGATCAWKKDEMKKIEVFPSNFARSSIGVFHKDKPVVLSDGALSAFKSHGVPLNALWDSDGRYSYLQPTDYVPVEGGGENSKIQITQRIETTPEKYLAALEHEHRADFAMALQLGADFDRKKNVVVLEFRRFYDWRLEDQNDDQPIVVV